MRKYLENRNKKVIEKLLIKNKVDIINDTTTEYLKLKSDFEKLIKELDTKEIDISKKKEFYDLFDNIRDKMNIMKYYYKYSVKYFRDKKYYYNVVIFLKNGLIKAFEIYEDKKTKGFTFNKEYYNLNRESIVFQNKKPFIFYVESTPAPIDFMKSKYNKGDKAFDLQLNGENIKDLIDGKAFKGIINLGKGDDSFWKFLDWKMAIIGIAIFLLVYLHMTGQIDLAQMLALGN